MPDKGFSVCGKYCRKVSVMDKSKQDTDKYFRDGK